VTGAVFCGLALDAQGDAEQFPASDERFGEARARFESDRDLAYGFLIGGVVTAGVGAVLLALMAGEEVIVVPLPGGVSARASVLMRSSGVTCNGRTIIRTFLVFAWCASYKPVIRLQAP